jgi:hypothetical protein
MQNTYVQPVAPVKRSRTDITLSGISHKDQAIALTFANIVIWLYMLNVIFPS